jgi:hypothetical protein
MKGQLQIRAGLSFPPENSERLVLMGGVGKDMRITYPTLLEGHVRIKNGTTALAYVRLFSNPRGARFASYKLGIEIRGREEISPSWWLSASSNNRQTYSITSPDGSNGICSLKILDSMNNWRPSVKGIKGGFEISRLLLRYVHTGEAVRVFRCVERVKENGSYRLVSKTPWKPKSPSLKNMSWNIVRQY